MKLYQKILNLKKTIGVQTQEKEVNIQTLEAFRVSQENVQRKISLLHIIIRVPKVQSKEPY